MLLPVAVVAGTDFVFGLYGWNAVHYAYVNSQIYIYIYIYTSEEGRIHVGSSHAFPSFFSSRSSFGSCGRVLDHIGVVDCWTVAPDFARVRNTLYKKIAGNNTTTPFSDVKEFLNSQRIPSIP